ncbi:MAG: hypothetical protein PHO07_04005, partial [Pirellulales bacterium]|nr:hypothetical protein [Pirellulales bacterium]
EFLRSANRSGALTDNKSWLIGPLVVQGQRPSTEPAPAAALNARNVSQEIPGNLAEETSEQPFHST